MPGGAPWPANTAAEVRGQAPLSVQVADGVDNFRQRYPLPNINPAPASGQDFYNTPGIPRVPATFPQAFTVRSFDHWAEYHLSGLHGVIRRVAGEPVGRLTEFESPYRAVFRPQPNAWDAGYWQPGGTG